MADASYINTAISNFKSITGYSIGLFLLKADDFFAQDFQNIENYYNGSTNNPNIISFRRLYNLISEHKKIIDLYKVYKNLFKYNYDWDLLDNIETIGSQLLTTSNLSKFLRSTRTKGSFLNKLQGNAIVSKYGTLETIVNNQIDNVRYDDLWTDLAFLNDLKEEDYGIGVNKNINIPLQQLAGIFLNSVVDNPIGERLYGLDMSKKFKFIDDDIQVLSYKETAAQSFEILANFKKGDNPQYRSLGVESKVIGTGYMASIRVPLMIRQMKEVFQSDDSFVDFSITKVAKVNDSLNIEFQANTVYGVLYSGNKII